MNVLLDPTAEQMVNERLQTARYSTAAEVVLAGLRALRRQEALDAEWAAIRAKAKEGIADADAGNLSDGEAFFDELEREEA